MLKALIEKKNEKIEAMQALVEACKSGNDYRAMTEEEQQKYNELKAEVAALDATIDAAKGVPAPEAVEKKGAGVSQEEADLKSFEKYLRTMKGEDTNMTYGDNGAVIPSSIANRIIQRVYEICPLYQDATRYNVGGTLMIPYEDAEQEITMAYASEFVNLTSSAQKLRSVTLTGFLAGALSKISKSLINNSQFDIVGYVVEKISQAAARWIEGELIAGTDSKIQGLRGVTQSVIATSATAVTADELIDLQEKVPDAFQANAYWIMNKATRTAIRKLKDGQGNYLLNKDATARWGYTLLGKDVRISDNMATMAANATAIFYGDYSGLAVKVSEDMSIDILQEVFAAQHAVGVVLWTEMDSKVENSQKIAKLVMAAS